MIIDRPIRTMEGIYRQAQSRIPRALSLPPTWLQTYQEFVTANASQVSQFESALRSLQYLIPGRFRDSGLASEFLHTLLLLISQYHTSLFPLPSRPSLHMRYTRFWSTSSPLYARTALFLRTIKYTELLCEMCAKRRSEKARWRLIVLLEILKSICRIVLMRETGGRMAVSPPIAERERVGSPVRNAPTDRHDDTFNEDIHPDESPSQEWTMPRIGLRLPPLPPTSSSNSNDSDPITAFLFSHVITADETKSAHRLLSRISTSTGYLAELLYIARPVIYALALQKLSSVSTARPADSKRDWRPWLLGLGIELAARSIARHDSRHAGTRSMTGLERDQWARRGWEILWWGMRGAFYERVTRRLLQRGVDALQGKPVLDLAAGVVDDYRWLWDEYYFSTATL